MALTLHVETAKWRAMVDDAWAAFPGLVPVVKGNGYGFGRAWLAQEAVQRGATEVAVGTIYEIAHVAALPVRPIVLTPSFDLDSARVPPQAVLTVGSLPQVDHLVRFRPGSPVSIKIATSMRRHGLAPHQIGAALHRLREAGCEVHSASIHPAFAGTDGERRIEVESLLPFLPPLMQLSVSHLDSGQYRLLRECHPDRELRIRLGSQLWHQDKSALTLRARVLEIRPVLMGVRAGYRSVPVPGDGTVVIVDAGSAHGVTPLADGASPFHYARRRMALLEPSHMHVSMVFVPNGDPCPTPGEDVDVQRPLLATDVDRIVWH